MAKATKTTPTADQDDALLTPAADPACAYCGMSKAQPTPAALDPHASVADCIAAIASVYDTVGVLGAALTKHTREAAGDAQLHSRLHRVQLLCGEFRAGLQAHVLHDLSVGPHAPRLRARG
jgi:hypothetical protein